ncbi:hypothetical protein BCR35DRAFT_176821 [Leucosporidium creatinivorum]|uniref:Uncharacterized protein n=1 Tax=Leucosporidium creatinivorum TaxID=106004 RepID=A0A1Y2FZ75_9BASI|nr:hypothetical protein BCR35DRAFT_176821 [Leucosporidium creatinivorum]
MRFECRPFKLGAATSVLARVWASLRRRGEDVVEGVGRALRFFIPFLSASRAMLCSSVLYSTILLFVTAVSATPFEHFETFFSFGDSYTATTGAPSHSPLCYSTAHETAGSTSGGLNWVQYLKARDLGKTFINFATISATTTNA